MMQQERKLENIQLCTIRPSICTISFYRVQIYFINPKRKLHFVGCITEFFMKGFL